MAAPLLAWIDQTMAQLGACRLVIAAVVAGQLPSSMPAAAPSEPPSSRLTAEEAARELKVEPSTINAWCRQGKFPGAKPLGKKGWRIPLEDVDALRIELPTRGRMRKVG